MMEWQKFEKAVREYANYIWNAPAQAEHVNGVDLDCVLKLDDDSWVIVEITQENTLTKIRKDITNINMVRMNLLQKNIYAKCFIVCDFTPTSGMRESGKEAHIKVVSFEEFQKIFFDFSSYKHARLRRQFGSAVDPNSGKPDTSRYTPVSYIEKTNKKEFKIFDIEKELLENRKIILLGDFGTGKSRSFQELFISMAEKAHETLIYPIAIDLRNTWGLINAIEIIRRHLDNLGVSQDNTNNMIKSYNGKNFCFLLDGFDEIGSRPWSENPKKLEEIRKNALQGIKDLISNTDSGVIISGRYHYFNGDDEMVRTLGLKDKNPLILECKEEFDIEEFEIFVEQNKLDVYIPDWIPKKPLILKTISSFDRDTVNKLFYSESKNNIEFWFIFIESMCERDAKIHAILDGEVIKEVLISLANETRTKPHNVGPLSESNIIDAFTQVTGSYPNEQATVMLQRLPGLGRVSSESGDRSFIDTFILDGLRGLDAERIILHANNQEWKSTWIQPLRKLGQDVLAYQINKLGNESAFIESSIRMIDNDIKNKTLIADIIASISRINNGKRIKYDSRTLSEATFGNLTFEYNKIDDLVLVDSVFETITLGTKDPNNMEIKNCVIEHIEGVSSQSGLPKWIDKDTCDIYTYEAIDTLTAIKQSGLSNSQTILVSILIKVYRQAGNGRREHTLTKGLASVNKKLLNKILKYLISNNILEISKDGDSGEKIYKPNKEYRSRIELLLEELGRSQDDLWNFVSKL